MELTDDVLEEAVAGGFDVVITHHPVLFSPVRSLVEARPKERLLRRVVENGLGVISVHTNLDSAEGGIADIAAEALGVRDATPLVPASSGWVKLVGFIPAGAVETVAQAVFSAGGGGVGDYSECAFCATGTGWFTPGDGSVPFVGTVGKPERVEETRWETVLPRGCMGAVVRAYVSAHPYEEPAFDLVPLENVLPSVGIGRVGLLGEKVRVGELARRVAEACGLTSVGWSGQGDRMVERVGILPGSGRGMVEKAVGQCEVLVTGELGYHEGEEATGRGLSLIDVPHGEIEWWAFRRWLKVLDDSVNKEDVEVVLSERWRDAWHRIDVRG